MEVLDNEMFQALRINWRTAQLTDRQRRLAEFAEKITRTPWKMMQDDLRPLQDSGLSDKDILDAVQVIGYFNYINRVADALGVPPEPEWGEAESRPKDKDSQ